MVNQLCSSLAFEIPLGVAMSQPQLDGAFHRQSEVPPQDCCFATRAQCKDILDMERQPDVAVVTSDKALGGSVSSPERIDLE